jgi:hypothetical protein
MLRDVNQQADYCGRELLSANGARFGQLGQVQLLVELFRPGECRIHALQ